MGGRPRRCRSLLVPVGLSSGPVVFPRCLYRFVLRPPPWPSPILLAAPFYSHGRHYHLPGLFLVARSSSDPPPTLPPTLTLLLLHPLLLHLPLLLLLLLLLFLLLLLHPLPLLLLPLLLLLLLLLPGLCAYVAPAILGSKFHSISPPGQQVRTGGISGCWC